jgi:ribonucleoside-diphosphate reductase alpha chain
MPDKSVTTGSIPTTGEGKDSRFTELKDIRKDVFLDRYSLKDEKGNPTELYPEQMWDRVAGGIAKVEKTPKLQESWKNKFYNSLKDFKFVPGGRILSGAGTDYDVTFYNCYVLPSPHDSRGGIIDNLKDMVEIMSRSGGVGINLSSLRPRGARVKKVNGTSSGPVVWSSLYSTATHDVIQQGGSRRGALMLMLWDWHPDIEEFIGVKEDLSKINGANLSVCISDKFMQAVKDDANWDLVFPDITDKDYDTLWDGDLESWKAKKKGVVLYKTVKAKEVWDKICHSAWRSAEPGLHFMERSNKWSNTWYFERLISTNPCGEQPLGAWSVCNLGAMNLSAFVKNGKMQYDELDKNVRVAIRFLDNVVDANKYFFEENAKQQLAIRRTGLGTLGLGDALIKMKIRYGSEEGIEEIEKIYRLIRDAAYDESADLAKEKGPFTYFEKDKYLKGHHIKDLPQKIREKIGNYGIRNAVLLTQAPTGTTSLVSGVSSGIEPVYDFAMVRRDRTGEHTIYHPLYQEWVDKANGDPKPDYFVAANDLTPEDHVRVQAIVQKYTDSSISKTVNAPNAHTVEEVKNLYTMAYDLGLKGVTYMRDGSREGVLSHIEEKKEEGNGRTEGNGHTKEQPMQVNGLVGRPDVLDGKTYRIKTPVGTAFVTVCLDEVGNPFEVFVTVGKAGSDLMADAEAIGRLISLSLRSQSLDQKKTLENVVYQLKGIGGSSATGFGKNQVRSLADAVSKVLESYLQSESKEVASIELKEISVVSDPVPHLEVGGIKTYTKDICPTCGAASFVNEEGCKKCHSCGYSAC